MTDRQGRVCHAAFDGNHGSNNRCGFAAVFGASNVGKSTLVNRLVGTKVSIVSPKVQTTRSKILGIFSEQETQVVLVDTPGVFLPRSRLDRAMVSAAWNGAAGADEVLLLLDSVKGYEAGSRRVVDQLKSLKRKTVLVLNKVDLVNKPSLLRLTEILSKEQIFTETFMISAKTGEGVGQLKAFLAKSLPEGPWLFPEDQVSDMTDRLLAAEITREKLYVQLHNELPYASAVQTEGWVSNNDGSVRIDQVIFVERDSQKSIIVGNGGRQIKKIGQEARKDLEKLLERRVHLFLFVKVREKWVDDPNRYREFGLDFNS